MVFSHSALLCGALEVIGAANGAFSRMVSVHFHVWSQRELQWLEPPPVEHTRKTSSFLAPSGYAVQVLLFAGSWKGTVVRVWAMVTAFGCGRSRAGIHPLEREL